MNNQISELVKRGHDAASELKASCGSVDVRAMAQLISDLAIQLDVSHVALTESRREFRAADATIHNLELKVAQLVAENAGLKAAFDKPQAYLSWHAIPPTWEDPLPCGEYLDVHDEAGHKNSDGTDCWPVFAKPEIETPATDAAIASIQAQGVEMYAVTLDRGADDAERNGFEDGMKFLRAEAESVREFAAQLRQGAEHE